MNFKYHGAVIPMVTSATANGDLDERATSRMIDHLLDGKVEGIFVLGTTGEGINVPKSCRKRLVELAAERMAGRSLLYVGLGDIQPSETGLANDYLRAGADLVVAHPPISSPVAPEKLSDWYHSLLDQLEGPLIL